jgi:YggT family protein
VGVLRGFEVTLVQMVAWIIEIYAYMVVARAIISWVSPDPYNPIVRFLYSATEPVLQRIRRVLPLHIGGMDFTPLALLFALFFVRNMLQALIYR